MKISLNEVNLLPIVAREEYGEDKELGRVVTKVSIDRAERYLSIDIEVYDRYDFRIEAEHITIPMERFLEAS